MATRAELLAAGGVPVGKTRAELLAAGGVPVEQSDAPVQTAAEHALGTGTFGLSNKLQADYYKARGSPDLAKARTEANPTSAVVGDIAGLFTPGPGAVGKIAREAGALVKGVKTARVVTGGVEGGLFGLSAVMNEDAMGDPGTSAEHIAAGVLGGALMGMGLHTAFGKVGDLGKSALVKAFGGKAVKDTLDTLAEKAVMRSIASGSDMGKRNLANRAENVARQAIDEGYTKGVPSLATAAERANSHAGGLFQKIQGGLEAVDKKASFDAVKAADRMQPLVDELNNNPARTATQTKMQEFVDKMRDVGGPGDFTVEIFGNKTPWSKISPSLQKTLQKDPGIAAKLANRSGGTAPNSFVKAWDTISSDELKGDPAMYRLRKELQSEIFDQAAAANPELGAGLKQLNTAHANALEFRTLATSKALNEGLGGMTLPLAGLITHGPVGAAGGYLTRGAAKIATERGGFAVASALDSLAGNGTLPKIAKGLQLYVRTHLADPAFGGPFRAVLETAAAKGADDLLRTHLSLAQQHSDYLPSLGMESETPDTIAAHVDKANRLAQLSDTATAAGNEVDKSVGRLLGSQPGRAPTFAAREPSTSEYRKVLDRLKVIASNAETGKNLADLAPNTAVMAQMAVQAAAAHLLDNAPHNPFEMLPPALQRPWAPAKGDLRSWFRRVDTVANPQSVIESMAHGEATAEQLDTLKTVYPAIYKEMQAKLAERLSAWTEPLSRKQRNQVQLLLGSLEDPAVTQLIQTVHQRSIPPPAGKPDQRQNIDAAKNELTQAQRMEQK